MDIYLIRHTAINVEPGTCYGQADIDLSESFAEDKEEVRSKLPAFSEAPVYYSSPLKRCRKLASALTAEKVHIDERLKELDFGEWEGQKWDEIDSDRLHEWMEDFVNGSCPGGESYLELNERVVDWWEELTGEDHVSVVVVTHAGVIRSLLAHVLEIPYSNSFRLTIDRGHISAISVNDQNLIVKFINR